jgi:hypothetical protein
MRSEILAAVNINITEELYLLVNNAVQFVGSQPTFRRNMSTPSSESEKLATSFHVCFLLDLFFDPEDGGDIFIRNAG